MVNNRRSEIAFYYHPGYNYLLKSTKYYKATMAWNKTKVQRQCQTSSSNPLYHWFHEIDVVSLKSSEALRIKLLLLNRLLLFLLKPVRTLDSRHLSFSLIESTHRDRIPMYVIPLRQDYWLSVGSKDLNKTSWNLLREEGERDELSCFMKNNGN